jgi:hypothetical protein
MSRRTAAEPARAAAWVAATWALVGPIGLAGADEPLRWKFKNGETMRFSVERKMTMDTKGMGIERKSTRSDTLDFSWTVLSAAPGGEAEIRHKIERIRLRAEEPPYMPLEFDSASTKDPQPGFEAITKQLKAEAGAEFIFKMKPTGEITDIKVPEETLKKLRDSAPAGAPGGEISEKALKETLLQSSPPSFPEDVLARGQSWKGRPAREPLPPFAALLVDRTFTYQGPDPQAPNRLLVGIETAVKLEPIEGADAKATIRKQEGKGSMTVDAQAGRVVSTRQSLKLEIAVAVMGQSLEQSSETSSTMTLVP